MKKKNSERNMVSFIQGAFLLGSIMMFLTAMEVYGPMSNLGVVAVSFFLFILLGVVIALAFVELEEGGE